MTGEPDASELADRLREEIGLRHQRQKIRDSVLGEIRRIAALHDDPLHQRVHAATLGVADALVSGRMTQEQVDRLVRATDWNLVGLVAQIAVRCETSEEAAEYLISNL